MAKVKLTDDQIESAAVKALQSALGGEGSDIAIARERNMRFYNAEPIGELAPPEIADRSDFVATDVADTIDGMLPQIMRLFVSSGDAVEFESQGQPGADAEAKLATAYINHLFYVRNDGIGVIHDWFKDALLLKVGYVKVWCEEEAEDSKQRYEGNTEDQLMMLMQDGWELDADPEQDEDGTLSFIVRKESRTKVVKVATVSPAHMRVDVNARWDDEPAMIGEEFWRRKFDWIEQGYDVEDASSGDHPSDTETLESLGELMTGSYEVPHESHELIRGATIYIKLDADGDGVAEWLRVTLINDKLATLEGKPDWEEVDDHPYVYICPIPRPHAFYGDCPADRAIEPQKLRTRTIRAIEDNMLLTVNQRTYINTDADVNIDDVLDSRAGGVVRGRGAAQNAIQPLVQPSLGAPAYQFNEYVASWAENRTGYNRYSAGTDQNALNKTKGGMEMLTAKADMRMELMARFFGAGMRKLFAKMLKLSIQYQNVAEMVAIGGQFYPINPSEFRNQYNVKINVGLGSGSKEQMAQRIMGLLQVLERGAMSGVVRPQHVSEAIKLYVEAMEFKNPERFVDPEPSGMPPNPQAYNQEKQQVQGQMKQMGEQLQQLVQENERLKSEKASKDGDLHLKSRELDLKGVEIEGRMMEAQANHGLKQRQQGFSESQATAEDQIAELSQKVEMLGQIIAQMIPEELHES